MSKENINLNVNDKINNNDTLRNNDTLKNNDKNDKKNNDEKNNDEKNNEKNDSETQYEEQLDILFDNYYVKSNSIINNVNNLRVRYKDIDDYFSQHYSRNNTNNSNILDVIGIYIKGQKILYTEAKTTCEQRLTFLMLPSILFTILSSIINLLIDNMNGKMITTVLNGIITFILAVINYLKLDARAEAHRSSAYKYDKLLSYIEFQSCKQLFLDYETGNMPEIFTKIENDVKDIKETNQFVLPEIIRYNFPLLSNINIFSEVKKILNEEMILMNQLSYLLNEIRNLEYSLYKDTSIKEESREGIKIQMEFKIVEKKELIKDILKLQGKYISLDKQFKDEMDRYSFRNKFRLRFLEWLKV